MLIVLRLLALVLALAGGWWLYQAWQGSPASVAALPEKGTYRGAVDPPLDRSSVQSLQERAHGQRFP